LDRNGHGAPQNLTEIVGEQIGKAKDWPQNPRAMSGCIRRLAPALRRVGIDVAFPRGKDKKRTRLIIISALRSGPHTPFVAPDSAQKFTSGPSAPSASVPNAIVGNGLAATPERTVFDAADGRDDGSGGTVRHTVRRNSLNSNDRTVADGADANFPPAPAPEKKSTSGWRARL
jgi:hypothetical protein